MYVGSRVQVGDRYLASNWTYESAKSQSSKPGRDIQLKVSISLVSPRNTLTSMRTWLVHDSMSTFLTSDTLSGLHSGLSSAI